MKTLLLLAFVGVILAAFVSAKYTGKVDEDADVEALLQQLEAADNSMKRGLDDDDDDSDDADDDDDDDEEIMKRMLFELKNEGVDEDASQADAVGKRGWFRRPRFPRFRLPRIRLPRVRVPRYPWWRYPYGKKK